MYLKTLRYIKINLYPHKNEKEKHEIKIITFNEKRAANNHMRE